jgi:hypothetical protein
MTALVRDDPPPADREVANDPKAMERAANLGKDFGGGGGPNL